MKPSTHLDEPRRLRPHSLLTLQQVADELQLSPRQVQRLVQRGLLTAYRVSDRALRVKRMDLDRYLERRRIKFVGRPLTDYSALAKAAGHRPQAEGEESAKQGNGEAEQWGA
jgi:excisionase family DNA binding protein